MNWSSFQGHPTEKVGMVSKVFWFPLLLILAVGPAWSDGYTAVKGDNLASLAQKWKIPAEVLQRANPGIDDGVLQPGEELWIPEKYLVKPGDTLFSLCRKWSVDQNQVLALNGLAAGAVLKRGQSLYVPRGPSGPGGAATNRSSGSQTGSTGFWPVDKVPHPEGDKLKSVSFATTGEPFRSVSAGTVVYLGEFRGVGRVLLVQGENKSVFGYGNFEDSAVKFGQVVTKGQVLGTTSPRTAQRLTFFGFLQSSPFDVFTAER